MRKVNIKGLEPVPIFLSSCILGLQIFGGLFNCIFFILLILFFSSNISFSQKKILKAFIYLWVALLLTSFPLFISSKESSMVQISLFYLKIWYINAASFCLICFCCIFHLILIYYFKKKFSTWYVWIVLIYSLQILCLYFYFNMESVFFFLLHYRTTSNKALLFYFILYVCLQASFNL